jgi:hypothetical protein
MLKYNYKFNPREISKVLNIFVCSWFDNTVYYEFSPSLEDVDILKKASNFFSKEGDESRNK